MEKLLNQIPIVDLNKLSGKFESYEATNAEFKKFADEFGTAMHKVGFAYLINHGVDMKKVEEIYRLAKQFFILPSETKSKYRKLDAAQSYHGYVGPGEERLNEAVKNSIELREQWDTWGPQQNSEKYFPMEVPGFKVAFDSLRIECDNLGKKLLRALALHLCMENPDFFVECHKILDDPKIRSQTHFRTLHYYQMDPTDSSIPLNAIRCGEHTDWGTITLLFQDMIGGLEVKRLDGSWIDAVPIKDSVLINTGQLIDLWSTGYFPATPHRVRIIDEDRTRRSARQSLVYFINPDGDTVVKPVVTPAPGMEYYLQREPLIAYDHYNRLIKDAYY